MKSEIRDDGCQVPILGASSQMGYTDKPLYDSKILVTGRVGTHGIVQRVKSESWPSDNTLVIQSQYYETVYQMLKRIDYPSLNRGSTQPLITQTDLKHYKMPSFEKEMLLIYEQKAEPLMTLYDHRIIENRKLGALRDTLLPKLMSGEIDVSQVDLT
ncbi:MAG: hypothetical protein RR547_13040, partial [Raoultibacter sp.]